MRRSTSFPQRALYFETFEQKRPLAINVLSCGDADPEAVVAEDGVASQHVADMATGPNSGPTGGNHNVETATADEDRDLANEKFSNSQSDLDASTDQVEIESDDPEEGISDDDDDSMMDDESDDENDDLSDDDDESDDDEEDSDEEDDDSNEDDLEDDEDESDEDDDESEDDEESDEVDDSDEEDDDSDEDDLEEDEDESDGDDDDDDEDDIDDEEDESDEEDSSDTGSEGTAEELSAARDGDDELNAAIRSDTSRSASSLFAFQGTVENSSQNFQAAPSTSRQLESHDDLLELLQLQSGNPSRDLHELSRDAFAELTSGEIVNLAGGHINDGVDAMLQSRLQAALVDAVFMSLG